MVSVHRDYIMRVIEQLGQVLAVVIGLRRSGYQDQALATAVREAGQLLGVDFEALRSLGRDEALQTLREDRLTRPGATDAEWWISLTVLLEEAADLYRRRGDADDARHFERIGELALNEIPASRESAKMLEHLLSGSDPAAPLPASLRTVLWRYHERTGAYAEAEDWLFDLLESDAPSDDLIRRAAAFYQRLSALPDEDLTRGGLPRAEVQEGLTHLWDVAAQAEAAAPDETR